MIRHAWLQKHPTRSAAGSEFHWHPADGDRELRAGLVERARGVEPPAVVWELAPGRVAWAQVFAATAPRDRRRYTGMVLTIVERTGAPVGELLAQLAVPAAAPWSEDTEARMQVLARGARPSPEDVLAAAYALALVPPGDLAALARSLLADGGAARAHVGADAFASLPAAVMALERCLPSSRQSRVRRGVWLAGTSGAKREDHVAQLLARACIEPSSRAGQGWRLLCELAEARSCSVDEVGGWHAAHDSEAVRSAALRASGSPSSALGANPAADGVTSFVAALHGWGRGRLDGTAPADQLAARFADALALRVLASLAADRDPTPHVAAARWHALLPAARRTLLFDTCALRCPAMRAVVGGVHA